MPYDPVSYHTNPLCLYAPITMPLCSYTLQAALDSLSPGDVTSIFTPDDTHFEIAKYAIEKGIHVLVTKVTALAVFQTRQVYN